MPINRRVVATACCWALLVCVVLWRSGPAAATPPALPPPAPEASGSPSPQGGFFSGLGRRSTLFGDPFGIRTALSRHGISLTASETSEELGNAAGGVRQSFVYDGLTQMDAQMDTQRAFGLYGGTFNLSALQLHGHNFSAENLDSLQTSSGIAGDQASRVWELWYQQLLNRQSTLDVKIGQQSLDQEFIVDQNASIFVNTMFG